MGEKIGLEPVEGGIDGAVGEGREDFVGDSDHEGDSRAGKRRESFGIGVEETDGGDSV